MDTDRTDAPAGGDVAAALEALSGSDMLRLRALARLHARALPGWVSWSDLLHEAVLRALSGARPWPPGVPLLAFLSGVMRSLRDEHWRRRRLEERAAFDHGDGNGVDPEQACAARQELAAIDRLFAADPLASRIVAGLADGLTAAEIRERHRLGETEYDSARRRIRRAMLRHGLRWTRR